MKIRRIEDYLYRNVVPGVSGTVDITVSLVDDPSAVAYDSYTNKGEQYSRSCTYRKTDLNVTVKISRQWWSRVRNRDLAMVDELFNLDVSTPLIGDFPSNVEVIAATWLVNGRGTEKKTVRGFIAIHSDGYAYHGKTIKSALRGLSKKIELQVYDKNFIKSRLIEKAKMANGNVSLDDSYAVGNCVWGTKDFCYRHGLDLKIEDPQISLKELAKIVEQEPRREALAVLAYGVRKHSQPSFSHNNVHRDRTHLRGKSV
ncbi:hypothetical protein VTH8203_03511 [Vibrio thalassae]|uniref:Uncharacterized protein n=2 Tax=Vibrio thalassae TaxID=1243014 RepID=A0A240ENP9_9VIBR|nr:hypothetical protein VTH8203_03511 [Vibrio thalassae]